MRPDGRGSIAKPKDDLGEWLEIASLPGAQGQRAFLREDLLLSRPACVDVDRALERDGPLQNRGFVWFLPETATGTASKVI